MGAPLVAYYAFLRAQSAVAPGLLKFRAASRDHDQMSSGSDFIVTRCLVGFL